MPLTWALAISTYNRGEVLLECIRLAAHQLMPPIEIIVVDASDNWRENREAVANAVRSLPILLIYEGAVHRSSATQRNQAISLVSADIVFLIDDDSFLFKDTALEIIRLYELDEEKTLAAIGAFEVQEAPTAKVNDFEAKVTGLNSSGSMGARIARSAIGRFFFRKVLMMQHEESFLPYNDDKFSSAPIPEQMRAENVYATNNIPGFALTVRTEIAKKYMFDQSLRYYAALEDADFCHRILASGSLIIAKAARVHHFQVAGGRISRDKVISLQLLNLALFLRKHSTNIAKKRKVYRNMLYRRFIAELLKDLLARRLSLPHVRGTICAFKYNSMVFDTPISEIDAVYLELQRTILGESG
jgi:GT2 family glycosyltransferase